MIKVLHIIWSASFGGISRVVHDLAIEQVKNKELRPSVFIAKSEGGMLVNFLNTPFKTYEGGLRHGSDLRPSLYRKVLNTFEEFDILHFHSYNPILASAAARSGRKIIYTEHGNFAFGRKVSVPEKISRALFRGFLNKHVDAMMFNSTFTEKESVSRYGLENVPRTIVANGVPELKNVKDPKLSDSSVLKICSIGRLAEVKRFDRLLQCIALLKDARITLTLAGNGPLRSVLEEQSHALGINDQVKFIGYTDPVPVIRESSVCVFPFQNEAFGLVAIEAYREGRPVLVFNDGGGITELVAGIEPEYIVSDNDAMVQLIRKFADDPELSSDMDAVSKRRKYAAGFSMHKMEAAVYSVYTGADVRN